jgi:hypothetical protein
MQSSSHRKTESVTTAILHLLDLSLDRKIKRAFEVSLKAFFVYYVPRTGIEPVRYCYHWFLRPARLPVPPPGLFNEQPGIW